MTPEEEVGERATVVDTARTYIGTPYHHRGRLKGVGVDCLTLLACVFRDCRLIEVPDKLPAYPRDWHLHRNEEKYEDGLLGYCDQVAGIAERVPLPGDIVTYKFGRTFSHGIIVEAWPKAIHSFVRSGVVPVDALANPLLTQIGEKVPDHGKPRPTKVYRLKRWSL